MLTADKELMMKRLTGRGKTMCERNDFLPIGLHVSLILNRLRNSAQLQRENSGDDSDRQPDVNREDGRQSKDRQNVLDNCARAVVRAEI